MPLPVSLRSNKCAVFCSPLQLAEAQDQLKKTELEAQAAREKLAAQERAAATSAEEAAIQVRPGPLTAPSTLDGADSKIWQAKAMKLDIHQTGQRAAIAEGGSKYDSEQASRDSARGHRHTGGLGQKG